MYQVGRSTIDADASAAAFTGDDVGFDASAIGVIYYLYAFAGIDVCLIHPVLVDGDRTDIIEVGFGDRYSMNLRFQNIQ